MEAEQCMNAAEIYQRLTGGKGAASLGDTQDAARRLSDRLRDAAGQVGKLAEYQRGVWHGEASHEAASNSCTPLMRAAEDDSGHVGIAQNAADFQAAMFQDAKNSVKPVSAAEPEFTERDLFALVSGNGHKYTDRVSQWQADSRHNVEVFGRYSSATGEANTIVPAKYAELTDTGAQISMTGADGPGKPSGPGPDGGSDGMPPGRRGPIVEHGPVPGSGPESGPGPNPGPRQPPGGTPVPPAGGHVPPPDDGLEPSKWPGPGPIRPPGGLPVGPPGGLPIAPPGNEPIGIGPIGFPPGGGAGGDSGGGYRGGVGPGGSAGSSGGAGSEPGARGGAGNEPGARNGTGARSGAGALGESAPARGGSAGAAGVTGKNGAGMGGMPAKGGKGEEDQEKKSASYLQEADPDGLFGSDVKPTPPVLGELPRR